MLHIQRSKKGNFSLIAILFFVNYFFSMITSAQTIPDSLVSDWSGSGYIGTILQPQNVADVTSFGAVPNDALDDYPALLSAMNSFNGNAGVVFFPPGDYQINSSVYLQDSITLRGAGADSTFLIFNLYNVTANCFNITKNQSASFIPVQSGYTRFSNKIIVQGADTIFSLNDHVELRQQNGNWDVVPVFWADYSVGHISTIDSLEGDTIFLHEALRINFDSALNPEIRRIVPRRECALECFRFTRSDSMATITNYGVYFVYAYNCRMRGVESFKSVSAHVWAEGSSHISVSGCYFHEAYEYNGTSSHGYGVVMAAHTCDSRIEDNIFRKLRHAMQIKQGANGNVFAYNYSLEPFRTEFPSNYAADISAHGHYAFANLFEGNYANNLNLDYDWGPSGPYNTFFRNRMSIYGIIMSGGSVQSDLQNFAGNSCPSTQPFQGNYLLSGSGHFEFGNNVKGMIVPAGTSPLPDSTYYLDSIPPAFWNVSLSFPSIGIPNAPAMESNPAFERYNSGSGLTICGYPMPSPTQIIFTSGSDSEILITGFNSQGLEFIIKCKFQEKILVNIYSSDGKKAYSGYRTLMTGINQVMIHMPDVSSGVYFLQIEGSRINYSTKIFISSGERK